MTLSPITSRELRNRKFYRFRSTSTPYFKSELVRALTRQEFYYSPIVSFNDPFDCNPVIEETSAEDLFKFYKKIGKRYLVSKEIIQEANPGKSTQAAKRERKKSFLVTLNNVRKTKRVFDQMFTVYRRETKGICLTEAWDSPLHWAHYADSHAGIAYELEVDLDAVEFTGDDIPLPIKYVRQRPKITQLHVQCWLEGSVFEKFPAYDSFASEAFDALNLTKSVEWEYEKEWRVQKRYPGDASYQYTPALRVSSIIVGTRCPLNTKNLILELCGKRCSVFQAQLDETDFRLRVTPL